MKIIKIIFYCLWNIKNYWNFLIWIMNIIEGCRDLIDFWIGDKNSCEKSPKNPNKQQIGNYQFRIVNKIMRRRGRKRK